MPESTTYRRPSVSIGMGLDGADYSYLTKTTPDSTGFFITFNVPFKRTDVFAELLSDDGQLGADGPDSGISYTILKPGREAGKLVRAARNHRTHAIAPSPCRVVALTREHAHARATAGVERLHTRDGV